MATKTGLKQQCPNCDANVPFKDEKLIGEEIKCPKCKQPFVVEDPDDPAPPPQKKVKKESSKGKSSGDDEDRGQEKGKKKSKFGDLSSPKMILGGGMALVAVILLAVSGYYMFGGPAAQTNSKTGTSGPKNTTNTPAAEQPNLAAAKTETPPKLDAKSKVAIHQGILNPNPTLLLPNESELVASLFVQEILNNRHGKKAFEKSLFLRNNEEGHFGIPPDEMDRWLVAMNQTQDWAFIVIRTMKPFNDLTVKKALHLQLAENPIQGLEYYQTKNNWLEGGSPVRFLGKINTSESAPAPGTRPLAVRFMDNQTLVLGDVAPIMEFLKNKEAFPAKATPTAVAVDPSKPPVTAPPPRDSKGSGPSMGGRTPGGLPGLAGPAPGATAVATGTGPISGSYLTLTTSMKMMLDQMEAKAPVLVSFAFDKDKIGDLIGGLTFAQTSRIMGFSIQQAEKYLGVMGMEYKDEEEAKKNRVELAKQIRLLIPLAEALNIKLEISDAAPGGANAPVLPQGDAGGVRPQARKVTFNTPGGAPPRQPGAPFQPPPQVETKKEELAKKTISAKANLSQQGRSVFLNLELELDPKIVEIVARQVEPYLVRALNEVDMATNHSTPHHLGDAIRNFDPKKEFPRGTARRLATGSRANRAWPPDQRVSWMAELLPFMGYKDTFDQIRTNSSWQSEDNLIPSITLIPEFLNPQASRSDWYIRYPGMDHDVASTSFVGISGIGLDAAEYDPKDPSKAGKLGIFGYDRVTRFSDITDGLSNTILMAQAPPSFKSPWLAGGGATIRGVPENRSIQPFVSSASNGKRGTLVLMADGSVRFVTENISDDIFKALCTIKGGEQVLKLNQLAPVVAPPEEPTDGLSLFGDPVAPASKEPKKPGS